MAAHHGFLDRARASWLVAVVVSLLASGCGTIKDAKTGIEEGKKTAEELSVQQTPYKRPLLGVVEGFWVSTDKVPEHAQKKLPPVFKESRQIRGDDLPLSWVLSNILANTGLNAVYSTSVRQNGRVSLTYEGDLKGALDAISSATGYRWDLRGNNIYWDDLETRTWSIPMTPGVSSFQSLVGGSVTTSIANAAAATGATGGAQTESTALGNTQRTERKSDAISVWGDLEKQISSLLSWKGTVRVSESTSSITVRDYSDRLNEVDVFIDRIVAELSRQVLVQVDVLEVRLNKSAQRGIDWSVIADRIGEYGFALTTGNTADIFPTDIAAPTLSYINDRPNEFNGTQILIKALQTQGDVSVKTQPRVVTLNNQVATLQIGTEVGYLAQSTTTPSTADGIPPTTSLTPGVAKSGFMMYLLPRLMKNNDVVMQMSLSVNTITQIRRVDAGGSAIEIPEVVTKNFQQLSKLRSGEAMVLTGFRQMNDSYDAAGVSHAFPWLFGADRGAKEQVDTIVVITPFIMSERG